MLLNFILSILSILPISGTEVGQAIADHPEVRKIGFTGSTPTDAQIMKR